MTCHPLQDATGNLDVDSVLDALLYVRKRSLAHLGTVATLQSASLK